MNKNGFFPAKLAKDPFVRTLKRTACLLAGQFVSANFKFVPGEVTVNMHNKEIGKLEESLPMTGYEGLEVESRFYSPYLLNGLQAFSEENVNFYLKNGAKPIIFEADENAGFHLIYLVMPVAMANVEN
jgi:DNA polymerase III sliding clamp (beta) subunit (PCNA family)